MGHSPTHPGLQTTEMNLASGGDSAGESCMLGEGFDSGSHRAIRGEGHQWSAPPRVRGRLSDHLQMASAMYATPHAAGEVAGGSGEGPLDQRG